jgi:hypothetical protein
MSWGTTSWKLAASAVSPQAHGERIAYAQESRQQSIVNLAEGIAQMGAAKRPESVDSQLQIDRFKELARELGCDEDEAAFAAAVKKLSESKPLPKHEPKKRTPKKST